MSHLSNLIGPKRRAAESRLRHLRAAKAPELTLGSYSADLIARKRRASDLLMRKARAAKSPEMHDVFLEGGLALRQQLRELAGLLITEGVRMPFAHMSLEVSP